MCLHIRTLRSFSKSNLNSLRQGCLEVWRAPGSTAIPIASGSFGEKHVSTQCLVWRLWPFNYNMILATVMQYYFHNLHTDLTSELRNFSWFCIFYWWFPVGSDFACPSIVTWHFSHKIWSLIRINSFQFTRL